MCTAYTVSTVDNDAHYRPEVNWVTGATNGRIGSDSGPVGRWDRFEGVAVPRGAAVTSATLLLHLSGGNIGPALVKSHCEASDNSVMPSNIEDADGRQLTSGTAWSVSAPFTPQTLAVDVTDEVQAVVNRSGWASGNAISVVTKDNGSLFNRYATTDFFDTGFGLQAQLVVCLAELSSSSFEPLPSRNQARYYRTVVYTH